LRGVRSKGTKKVVAGRKRRSGVALGGHLGVLNTFRTEKGRLGGGGGPISEITCRGTEGVPSPKRQGARRKNSQGWESETPNTKTPALFADWVCSLDFALHAYLEAHGTDGKKKKRKKRFAE